MTSNGRGNCQDYGVFSIEAPKTMLIAFYRFIASGMVGYYYFEEPMPLNDDKGLKEEES